MIFSIACFSPPRLNLKTLLPLLGLTFSACQPEPAPEVVVALSPREQLIRLSMDLRGIHPTEDELLAIEKSPTLYESYVDRYLQDPRFLDRMVEIFDLRYHLRTGQVPYDPEDAGMTGVDEIELANDIAHEGLGLLRQVIQDDRPYSDMVTAPYTLANAWVAQYWDMDYPQGTTGWIETHYKDGRPESGILTMSSFWARYPSMGGNANRHRANAISRVFLCDDFLARPIVVNRAAVDLLSIDPETAINTNPGCQSCHSSLDPIAANFFGFFHEDDDGLLSSRTYRPENEGMWRNYSGKKPGYFGRPTSGVVELGQELAKDPRFADCAVRTVFEGLTQRNVDDFEWPELSRHRSAFEGSGQNIRALVKSIVTDSYYKAGKVVGDETLATQLETVHTASPEQLASTIQAITGYSWLFRGQDALKTQVIGLPVLAGGTDGRSVTQRSYNPAVGVALVQERIAQAAAWHVVRHDFDPARAGDAYLLAFVRPTDTPDNTPDAFKDQIRQLYLRITGIPLEEDAPEIQELMDLWVYLHSVSASSSDAWAGVVTAVLRDPRVLFY